MKVTILDTQTGETRVDERMSGWWWAYGNGCCDCNRELQFRDHDEDNNPCCLGEHRYLITKAEPNGQEMDFNEGHPFTIAELNEYYPQELKDKFLPK
jgi:hypothetical protein